MTSKIKIKSVQELSLDVIADQDENDSEGGANEESKLKQKDDDNSYGEVSLDVVEEGEYSQQQINEKNLESEIKNLMDRKNWEQAYEKLKELSNLNQANPV